MTGDVLTALVSTMMLTIGDTYRIPYLYLPWLVNTLEGMAFHEGPALFGLAYTILPNANLSTGLFMFITFLLYGKIKNVHKKLISTHMIQKIKKMLSKTFDVETCFSDIIKL